MGEGISRQRSIGSNPELVSKFLVEVHRVVVEDKIPPTNMWNMDERDFKWGLLVSVELLLEQEGGIHDFGWVGKRSL